MKIINGKIEFFSELGITCAAIRMSSSRGSFDGVLSIKVNDRLILKDSDGSIIFDAVITENRELQLKHHSAVLIPQNVEYETWMDYLRKGYTAELHTNRNPFSA